MKIALLGDIGLLGNFSITFNPNLKSQIKEVAEFLSQFDLVVGNLETPFSARRNTYGAKSSYICTDPENITILKDLHIDAVSIANNHMFDFGKEGFELTLKLLEQNGINWFGANGKNFEFIKDNNKLVFEGFCCYSTNPLKIAKAYGRYGINRFNLTEAVNILNDNAGKGYLNIFSIHSGLEHVNAPSPEQIFAARELSKSAPYIWYGHHPHVIQGIETHNNSLVAHSLGNFCFAGNKVDKNRPQIDLSENNRTGMILILEVNDNKITKYEIVTTHINDDGSISLNAEDKHTVEEYSRLIKKCDDDMELYRNARTSQRNQYLSKRKELRNLKWILKRLRPRYVKLLLTNKLNSKRYIQNIKNPLLESGYPL